MYEFYKANIDLPINEQIYCPLTTTSELYKYIHHHEKQYLSAGPDNNMYSRLS